MNFGGYLSKYKLMVFSQAQCQGKRKRVATAMFATVRLATSSITEAGGLVTVEVSEQRLEESASRDCPTGGSTPYKVTKSRH